MEIVAVEFLGTLGFLGFLFLIMYIFYVMWMKPYQIRKKLEKQGIKGPIPSFLSGNDAEMKKMIKAAATNKRASKIPEHVVYDAILFPYLKQWRKQYGPFFMYSTGNKLQLYMNRLDLVKEMSMCMSWDLGKPMHFTKALAPILGNGVIRSNGQAWAEQRKIIAPEFFLEKVKGMVGLMVESAESLVKTWEEQINNGGGVAEIKIDQDLRNFSADVISRACFGSSYSKGEEIFSKLRTLKNTIYKRALMHGSSTYQNYLPTKSNRKIRRLEKEVDSLIFKVVNRRKEGIESESKNDHFLKLIIKGANEEFPGLVIPNHFVIDNCKNIYFAGHETAAITATWCLMLLALHPEWQDHLRAEIFEVCGNQFPDANAIRKLKMVKMVIQETLRLYPPTALISREVLKEMKIGSYVIPKGVCIWISISALHQDPEVWGPDATKFNPERFANGISEACNKLPQAYVPFGIGPRVCLGQNFAMEELKTILAIILSKFSFSLSTKYMHSPVYRMTIEPEHGVDLLMKMVVQERGSNGQCCEKS